MRISLIGMSGSGKSHWSLRLVAEGFHRFCCDDMIAERLSDELRRPDGTVMDMGEWMGFPYDGGYGQRELKYLECEIQVLNGVLKWMSRHGREPDEKVVIDTTGSVIHAGEAILSALRRETTVVHLETPPEVRRLMLENYIRRPRPVLWRDLFQKGPNESDESALARCYPQLLGHRERLYEQFAHLTVPYSVHREGGQGVGEFLRLVCTVERC